jgi:hypothetical protein
MREQIAHVPLGVVANISAWNYPWFVGCNVVVPALLTGNAVLYKPSEFATLTGLAMVRLLHDAGVPDDVLALPGGRRARPARRCWRSRSTACSSPAAMPPAPASRRRWRAGWSSCSSSSAARTRPTCAPTPTPRPRPSRWPTAPCTTPARAAARSSASTCTSRCTTRSSSTFVATVQGLQGRRPRRATTPTSAPSPARRSSTVLDAQVADAKAKGATLRRRRPPARPRQLPTRPPCSPT